MSTTSQTTLSTRKSVWLEYTVWVYLFLLLVSALLPYTLFEFTALLLFNIPILLYAGGLLILLSFAKRQRVFEEPKVPSIFLLALGMLFWLPVLVMLDTVVVPPIQINGYLYRFIFAVVLCVVSFYSGKKLIPWVKKSKDALLLTWIAAIAISYVVEQIAWTRTS